MEQFHSFDGTKFEESIRNKTNFTRLRVSVVNAIRNDPTSSRGETDQALKMLWDGCPEVFEEKRDLEYEELRPDPDTWDEDYFLLYIAYVKDNFCPERINQLRTIGKKVYGKPAAPAGNHTPPKSTVTTPKTPQKAVQPKAATPARTTPKSATPNPTRAPEQKKPPLAAGILIVAVLVLVVLAVCLLGKGTNAHAAAVILNTPEMLPLLPQQLMQMLK